MRHTSALSLLSLAIVLSLVTSPDLRATEPAVSWPGLRGPGHDGAIRDAKLFDGRIEGIEAIWQRDLGPGYPMVVGDGERLATAFQSGAEDVVAVFDPETGEELWRHSIGQAYAGHTGSHDGPIATPALADDRVFVLGPRGHLLALDANDGSVLWSKHLADDLGSEPPFYGFTSSPIVVDEIVVVQIGAGEGKGIAGFDVASGEMLWSAADDPVQYHSPVLATLGGRRQVVAAGDTHLTGVDPANGEVLWSHEHTGDERAMGGATIVPVPAGENRILLLHRHPESVMLEIDTGDDGSWQIEELWTGRGIKSTYVIPVYHDGYLYGMNNKIFTCIDAATGETVWRDREPGDGFPTLVGDHLVIMSKPGTLRVAEASPEGYKELTRLKLFDEVSWSAPAYIDGSLYVRSMSSIARISSSAPADATAEEIAEAAGRTSFDRFLADLEQAENKDHLIDAYLAANWPLPVIEHTGRVHFLYRGEANDVGIVGDMIGFRREDPMIRVAGTDLFHYSTRLEPDAAVHYGFLVDFGEPSPDPFNPRRSEGLFGEVSFFEMPGRQAGDFAGTVDEARQGVLEELTWESTVLEGATRAAQVYLPAGYDPESERPYPTLYVHDGQDALEKGDFKNALDELIGESVMPLIAVFVTPDPEKRGEMRDPNYAKMLREELVPLIDERYRTIDNPMARGTAGFVNAADVSLSLAFTAAETFARIGAIWPVLFAFEDEPPAASDSALVLYQKWGSYHLRSPHENFDSAQANREMFQQLRRLGHRPAGGEVPEGFGWSCWRAYVGEMLTSLFPMG
jgi:enterochelin esterase-like enzyme/outer membrane protein assembly factor BamB